MAILPVVKYGDPILRQKVRNVVDFENLNSLIKDMFETMYHEQGIGLAANQIGVDKNILVFDISHYDDDGDLSDDSEPMILINTKIVESTGTCIMEEGCLSVPDIRAEVTRPETIKIRYQDLDGNMHEKEFSGLSSRVLQHEIDHLNGKFFTDYLSPSKRKLIQKRLLEISQTGKPSTGIII